MRIFTSLRTHPAVLATPFIGAFFCYVFLTSTRRIEQLIDLPWAAQAVSYAAHAPVPMAAAAAAGLTAVEATRLKALGAWQLGTVQPTWRIALQTVLVTVACLSTATAGVMAGGLWVVGVLPDPYALQILGIVVVLITAHAVIGFVVGRHLHALYSAPLVAVAVFVGISFPLGTDSYWAHHVTGAIDWVGFGEAYSPAMTVAAILPTVGLALACVALASFRRDPVRFIALSLVLAVGGLLGAYGITADWRSVPPTAKGLAPVVCEGNAPEVCLPEAGADHIGEIHAGLRRMTGHLEARGIVTRKPERITDISVADVRRIDTDGADWTLALAPGTGDQVLRENIAISVVGMPCAEPDWNELHVPTLWAARTIGVENHYLTWLARETRQFSQGQTREQLLSGTASAARLPLPEQKKWYAQKLASACRTGSPS
ncbi:magnesium transporter [Streptomyces californicus]|uniref:magnesium transporter n=1 Tax=Streptomyces californicus TaxID=67351 RepID=UPI0037B69C79